jgi:IS1 family transposase
MALCRKTRQVVAYARGDRNEKTCQKLWNAIPLVYRASHCSTDFWRAYQAVISEEQHSASGKETGATAHVERWNNILRQCIDRFVRKSLFSLNYCLCMMLVSVSFSIATTWNGPASLSEPLPRVFFNNLASLWYERGQ